MIKYYIVKIIRKILLASAVKNSKLHKTSQIGIGCNIVNSTMGKYSYVGDNTNISMTSIGSFTSISSNCSIGGGAHPIDRVSTSPAFTDTRSILGVTLVPNHFEAHRPTSIGNDVWIGTHVLIKAGITIADGAIIGMGSVVTKNVGEYEIWAGNPAKLIRKRFSDDTIERLIKSKWWNLDDRTLKKVGAEVDNVDRFLEKVECL